MNAIGRIVDPAALAASEGPRALVKISVPAAWASAAALVDVTVPKRLACAACEGGGCDGCDRTGALRAPEDAQHRRVRFRLPGSIGDGVRVRLADPFGKRAKISQIWIEVRPGSAASPGVVRVQTRRERPSLVRRMLPALATAVAIIALLLALITWLR